VTDSGVIGIVLQDAIDHSLLLPVERIVQLFAAAALGRIGQNVRIRLDPTCVNVRDAGDEVLVGYAAKHSCSHAST
jgi:hypothetical protein